MSELCFGQRIDMENGLIQPWFTHGALDELASMDLTGRNILMFGSGMGDSWLARRCKSLFIVERNEEWLNRSTIATTQNGVTNITYLYRPCNDSSGMAEYYMEVPDGVNPDIIINDDAYRTEVCQMAVDYFKSNGGGILISDNWIQSFVWISPKAEEIMSPFECKIFEQADHADNDGVNKWKTAYHFIK